MTMLHNDECDLLMGRFSDLEQEVKRLRRVVKRLRAALQAELDLLVADTQYSTHYAGCEIVHRKCAAIKRIRQALETSDGE